jgi:protease-4
MNNPDLLTERLKLKSQVSTWRTITFIILILSVLAAFGINKGIDKLQNPNKSDKPYIARVSLDGIIFEDQERLDIIKELAEDDKVKAVILHVNSPGGSAVGGESVYKALKELNTKKPVVVVMNSLAASAAYLVTLGTSQIFAQNGTITGSIGVIMEIPNLKKVADKIGVDYEYIKTSPLKGSPNLFEARNEDAIKVLDTMMQDFYQYFVEVVATERKIPFDVAKKLADGRVFSGKAALDNKLVDAIGGEQEAHNWLIKNESIDSKLKIEEVKLYKPKSKFEEFLGSLSENLGIESLTGKIFNFKGLLS